MTQDTAFTCMDCFVNAAVCVVGVFCGWEDSVEG